MHDGSSHPVPDQRAAIARLVLTQRLQVRDRLALDQDGELAATEDRLLAQLTGIAD